jgi:hypothetical protein
MDVKVTQQPTLTKGEWDLVMELIEREQKELHAEIHQTTRVLTERKYPSG